VIVDVLFRDTGRRGCASDSVGLNCGRFWVDFGLKAGVSYGVGDVSIF
jgi:hypothetical protein